MFDNKGDKLLLNVSGGKDSTAMILYMKENGFKPEELDYIFFDTGWESVKTYQYLDYLEDRLNITIQRRRSNIFVRPKDEEIYNQCLEVMGRTYSDMVALILDRQMFPSRIAQYCTGQLKIKPFVDFLEEQDYQAISCVGIRREESARRAAYTEWEFNESFDCWVWRPLIEYTERDVIDIHKRHDVMPNPLYLEESHRVGCYPCINSNKAEMKSFPPGHEHLEVIRIIEKFFSERRGKPVTFFRNGFIDEVLDWAKTSRGGKQYYLFDASERTCEKWGMCGI